MKKRIMAVILGAALTLGCVGCGGAEGTEDDAALSSEDTALSLMQAVNGTDSLVRQGEASDDNYRTWYEVFLYSFYDSDGDGIGDLNGLTAQLDYINDGDDALGEDLGCTGIWLMPVMPSPTYHKYDVTDYCDIDPEYGTLEDFDVFVEACHQRGIHVILDLVMNHSSAKHPWFTAACEYLENLAPGEEPDESECPYVEYYHFTREQKGGYARLGDTEWYYEAQFWSEMPDLNLSSAAVREEFSGIVDFWLARGVDGFRLDAAKEYESGSVDGNIEILSWFNDMVKEKKEDAYLVAEVWTDMPTYAKYYESGIDSCFNFAFADKDGTIAKAVKGTAGADSYGRAIEDFEETAAKYSDTYMDAPFYSNHDMARSAGYYAGDYSENQTKMGLAMNLLMSGNAFLYYGEELGMKGSGKDENKRAPMYWSSDETAEGMCAGPADMDTVKMKYGSLQEQQEDGDSVYCFVREALRLRRQYPAIARGKTQFDEEFSNENVCVLNRYDGENQVELVFNMSPETQRIKVPAVNLLKSGNPDPKIAGLLLTTTETATLQDGILTLPPYSIVLLTDEI